MTLAHTTPQKFEVHLKEIATEVDRVLSALLPPGELGRLQAAMAYAVLGQGKRLRPFLVVASAALYDVDRAQALRVGAALELLHCYSLVHDDLPAMDDDDLRRGQPTVHRKFDEATAILAGDALLTLAFAVLAGTATHADANVRVKLVAELAQAAGAAGMVGGQMADIEAEKLGFESYTAIARMQGMKTGALFRFACGAGAYLAGAEAGPLLAYADHIGLAFQIADDILDVESSASALGKATQKDRGKGKATFVDLLGLQGAKEEAQALVNRACDELAPYGAKAAALVDAAQFIVARQR